MRPMLTAEPPSSRHPPVRSVPRSMRRLLSTVTALPAGPLGGCTRAAANCAIISVFTPALSSRRRLSSSPPEGRRVTVIPVVDYEPALAAGPQPPPVPADRQRPPASACRAHRPAGAVRSVPPCGHVHRRRAARRPRGDRPSPAHHTAAADAVHRTHRLGGLLRPRAPARVGAVSCGAAEAIAPDERAFEVSASYTRGPRLHAVACRVEQVSTPQGAPGRSSPFIWASPSHGLALHRLARLGPVLVLAGLDADAPPPDAPAGWVTRRRGRALLAAAVALHLRGAVLGRAAVGELGCLGLNSLGAQARRCGMSSNRPVPVPSAHRTGRPPATAPPRSGRRPPRIRPGPPERPPATGQPAAQGAASTCTLNRNPMDSSRPRRACR